MQANLRQLECKKIKYRIYSSFWLFRTPPTLVTEQKDEAIVEKPVVSVNSDEPPLKKHKKEKKHKRDKNREMHFETEEQKAEYVLNTFKLFKVLAFQIRKATKRTQRKEIAREGS